MMMGKTFLLAALVLASCSEPVASFNDQIAQYDAEQQVSNDRLAASVNTGDLVLTFEHRRPVLTDERWFKVEDQYGCKWWITNGHKFDQRQIDVLKNGEANCSNLESAPDKSPVYRDRAGRVVDATGL